MAYVGRFAPSPTGDLHLGSLFTAVASYLHARQNRGRWLLRIEDVDPPREVPGSATSIQRGLEALALEWDGPVLMQSSRFDEYAAIAAELVRDELAFYCSCTRSAIPRNAAGIRHYPGTCRTRSSHEGRTGIRMRLDRSELRFTDRLQGEQCWARENSEGDYLIVRRDGLPAYHLAVVVDDALQGITDVVRGSDLLSSTPLHIHLQEALSLPSPRYWHVPVLTNASGAKLSKQQGAAPIDPLSAPRYAASVLTLLELPPPPELERAPAAELWKWAIEAFDIGRLAGREALTPPESLLGMADERKS